MNHMTYEQAQSVYWGSDREVYLSYYWDYIYELRRGGVINRRIHFKLFSDRIIMSSEELLQEYLQAMLYHGYANSSEKEDLLDYFERLFMVLRAECRTGYSEYTLELLKEVNTVYHDPEKSYSQIYNNPIEKYLAEIISDENLPLKDPEYEVLYEILFDSNFICTYNVFNGIREDLNTENIGYMYVLWYCRYSNYEWFEENRDLVEDIISEVTRRAYLHDAWREVESRFQFVSMNEGTRDNDYWVDSRVKEEVQKLIIQYAKINDSAYILLKLKHLLTSDSCVPYVPSFYTIGIMIDTIDISPLHDLLTQDEQTSMMEIELELVTNPMVTEIGKYEKEINMYMFENYYN